MKLTFNLNRIVGLTLLGSVCFHAYGLWALLLFLGIVFLLPGTSIKVERRGNKYDE